MPIQITAKREGFRRCGIAHSEKTTTYPDGHFTDAQLRELGSEPNLIVMKVDVRPAMTSNDDALSRALARIAELESGLTQLSSDADALKQQLADSEQRLSMVTAERDALLEKAEPQPAATDANSADVKKESEISTDDIKADKKKG